MVNQKTSKKPSLNKKSDIESIIALLKSKNVKPIGRYSLDYDLIVKEVITREYWPTKPQHNYEKDVYQLGVQSLLRHDYDFKKIVLEKLPKLDLEEIASSLTKKNRDSLANALTDYAKVNSPPTYYSFCVDVYYGLRKECSRFSENMHELSLKLDVRFASESEIPVNGIKALEGADVMKALTNLPTHLWGDIFSKETFSKEQFQKLKNELYVMDKKRNDFHLMILEYAKKHLKKDKFDVYADILTREYLGTTSTGLINMQIPRLKPNVAIINFGLIEIQDCTHEFSREYGVVDESTSWLNASRKDSVKHAMETLDKLRLEKIDFFKPRYKSIIKGGRNETEDDELINKIRKQFPSYISFSGEFFNGTSHGHSFFSKLIEIDLSKIKAKEENPENKLDEIKNYVASLIPKEIIIP